MKSKITTISNQTIALTGQSPYEYSRVLVDFGISYVEESPYLIVGKPRQTQGWILHVSVIYSQCAELILKILPILSHFAVAYKLVKDQAEVRKFNNGFYGRSKVGKIVTIFLDDQIEITRLVESLLKITKGYLGPEVPTDIALQGNLSYRYGAFIPIILTDSFGNKGRYIKDSTGSFVRDEYLHTGIDYSAINNPLLQFQEVRKVSPELKYFLKCFKPRTPLKIDIKGNVFKAVYFKYKIIPKWCIIKEGKLGILANAEERDMRHRIINQFYLLKQFEKLLKTPKPLSLLQDQKQVLFAMSYVEGEWLIKKCFSILDNRKFQNVNLNAKNKILDFLIGVINIIKIIHSQGYVHRDITGTNFLVTPKDELFLLDFELCTPVRSAPRQIAFTGGTPGYMSPQQDSYEAPRYEDDIYAFGALMITCLTGLEASLIIDDDILLLKEKLKFYIDEDKIIVLIIQCLQFDRKDRPSLDLIYTSLKESKKTFSQSPNKVSKVISEQILFEVIQKCIESLSNNSMANGGLWFSYVENQFDHSVHPLYNKTNFWNLYKGIAGPLLVLSEASRSGFDIKNSEEHSKIALNFLNAEVFGKIDQLSQGLFYGTSGLSFMLSSGVRSKLIPSQDLYTETIGKCLAKESSTFDLINGASGDGIAILHSEEHLEKGYFKYLLFRVVDNLISNQERNGSWKLSVKEDDYLVSSSFGYGVAGIVFFLLESYKRFNKSETLFAVEKGLYYLRNICKRLRLEMSWRNNSNDVTHGLWWCKGSPGIALAFLKAYEVLDNVNYRNIAENILRAVPKNIISHQVGLCHGIAGQGCVYLEAFRVLEDEEWLKYSYDILDFILHYRQSSTHKGVSWLVEQFNFPTAEFMTGNSGIMYYLLKHYKRNESHLSFI